MYVLGKISNHPMVPPYAQNLQETGLTFFILMTNRITHGMKSYAGFAKGTLLMVQPVSKFIGKTQAERKL